MKRTISIIVMLMLCLSFFASCTQNDGDPAKFDFSLEVEKDKYARGETIYITARVTNISGKTYRYTGSAGHDFYPMISLYRGDDEQKYEIAYEPYSRPAQAENVYKKIKNGESGVWEYEFQIPADAELGNYRVTLSYREEEREFYDVLSIVELTAQNETDKYRYSSSIVSSGQNNIQPIQCMRGTTQYEKGEPVLNGCGDGVYRIFDDPETQLSDIPVLAWSGDVNVTVPVNVLLGYIKVYGTDYEELGFAIEGFRDLSALPHGEYLIVFAEQIDGRGCDAEIEDFWITDNECLFRLVIPEPSSKDLEETEYQAALKMMLYNWDGYGVSIKTIAACDLAYSIIDALEDMPETGETVDKISEETVDEYSGVLPVKGGTMWIDVGTDIYRLNPDNTQLCRVKEHLGKGYVIEMTEQFKTMIRDAWHYHPYDYYSGTYINESDELVVNHVYEADSSIQIQVKKIEVENKYHPTNKITVELVSTIDQTVDVRVDCYRSDDDLDGGDYKELTLKAGKKQTVELNFGGWENSDFWIMISADNTRINLRIEP